MDINNKSNELNYYSMLKIVHERKNTKEYQVLNDKVNKLVNDRILEYKNIILKKSKLPRELRDFLLSDMFEKIYILSLKKSDLELTTEEIIKLSELNDLQNLYFNKNL